MEPYTSKGMSQDRAYGYMRYSSGAIGDAFHKMYEATAADRALTKRPTNWSTSLVLPQQKSIRDWNCM
jgi:hypothetical protein